MNSDNLKTKIWIALLALYVVWGSTYLGIRIAIGAERLSDVRSGDSAVRRPLSNADALLTLNGNVAAAGRSCIVP